MIRPVEEGFYRWGPDADDPSCPQVIELQKRDHRRWYFRYHNKSSWSRLDSSPEEHIASGWWVPAVTSSMAVSDGL